VTTRTDRKLTGLSVQGLGVLRGGVPILTGLSFDLSPGEAVLVRGPNGSGKSTLLRALAGLIRPDEGVIAPEDLAEQAHALGHRDPVKPSLSVRRQLAFVSAVLGASPDDAAMGRALQVVGLAGIADRQGSAGG
jgi:heme exporter protein A